MERAEARKLQPHFIADFFLEAFKHLGGKIHERETGRYEITNVPVSIRERDRQIGIGDALRKAYQRVTFKKELINVQGKPLAYFVCPGSPLMEAVVDLILERYRDLLRQGAILVDPTDSSENPRALFYLQHSIRDGRPDNTGGRRVVSRQMQFVEIGQDGNARMAGYAPYLDYRPVTEEELDKLIPVLEESWIRKDLEDQALNYAVANLVPTHIREVRTRKEQFVQKCLEQVHERLTKEIMHWDHRAQQLRAKEDAGKKPKLNSGKAQARSEDLSRRLKSRTEELELERHVSPDPPVAFGGALIIPQGLFERVCPDSKSENVGAFSSDNKEMEQIGMDTVAEIERGLGFAPEDVSQENCGYDILSRGDKAVMRFIEVKARQAGADTVYVTKNEILTACNKPDQYILALVLVDGDSRTTHYIREPFNTQLGWSMIGVHCKISDLLQKAETPS